MEGGRVEDWREERNGRRYLCYHLHHSLISCSLCFSYACLLAVSPVFLHSLLPPSLVLYPLPGRPSPLVCRAHSLLLFKYLLTCRSPDGPFLDIPCLPSPMSLYPALFFFIFAEYLLLTDIVYTRGLTCFFPKDTLRKTAIFCCID